MEQIKEKNSVLSQGHGDRVTGLFGKDEVLGSFLSKLLPILLAFYFFIKKDKINTKLVLFILTIFLLSTYFR